MTNMPIKLSRQTAQELGRMAEQMKQANESSAPLRERLLKQVDTICETDRLLGIEKETSHYENLREKIRQAWPT